MADRKAAKVIIGTVVISLAVAYLLYEAAKSSWAYYYSVDEFAENQPAKINGDYVVRLAGTVKAGSIKVDADKLQIDFELAGQKNSISVRYYGALPKNFADGKEVLVEGRADANGVFNAGQILTRCESKYKAKLKYGQ
jgi:cytochrome c-type biogenesis protein CcmE